MNLALAVFLIVVVFVAGSWSAPGVTKNKKLIQECEEQLPKDQKCVLIAVPKAK